MSIHMLASRKEENIVILAQTITAFHATSPPFAHGGKSRSYEISKPYLN